jgi:glycosyltransferase involved in cell wall biosynthesis
MSKKKVLVDLSPLAPGLPYTNAIQFGSTLKKNILPDIDWHFLLPSSYETALGTDTNLEKASFKRRFFPSLCTTYDLWHSWHEASDWRPAASLRSRRILTIQDFVFTESATADYPKKLKTLQKNIDQAGVVVFLSEFSKEKANAVLSFQNCDQSVIHNGHVVPILPEGSTPPAFMPFSNFIYAKGIDHENSNVLVLLDLLRAQPMLSLVLAGNKNSRYAASIEKRMEEYYLQGRVIFAGNIDTATEQYLLQNCQAFCLPSLYQNDSQDIFLAMRHGKPVFVSRTVGLPQEVKEMVFYWEDYSIDHMAHVYQQSLIHFNRMQANAQALADYAATQTWEKTVKEYLELYQSLL